MGLKNYSRGSLEGSPTLANLKNDHGFITKKYISGTRHFGEAQSKTTRVYAQSRQYHTIVEGRIFLCTAIC